MSSATAVVKFGDLGATAGTGFVNWELLLFYIQTP